MSYSPVVMFVYNRANHLEQTFKALSECVGAKETELFIFADGAKNEAGAAKVEECRKAVRAAAASDAFKSITVTESPENRGLAASVIAGVTAVTEKYGKAIVVEDDCVASPYFLTFMNECLDTFAEDRRIGAVAGYAPAIEFPAEYKDDIFTSNRSCSWGWATWADRWKDVDWELKDFRDFYRHPSLIRKLNSNGSDRFLRLYRQTKGNGSSWSVRFGAHLVKKGMLTVYPRYSYVSNIGCDASGVHSKAEDAESMAVDLSKAIAQPRIEYTPLNGKIQRIMKKHYSSGAVSELKRFAATCALVIKGNIMK